MINKLLIFDLRSACMCTSCPHHGLAIEPPYINLDLERYFIFLSLSLSLSLSISLEELEGERERESVCVRLGQKKELVTKLSHLYLPKES
jgi:hypothetical protein